jgi:hypothetical protein
MFFNIHIASQIWAQLPLSVDPLINGSALIFHFENVNLTEERLFLSLFKGTVPSDFSPLVFFFKQLLLAAVDKPSNDFDFFRIYW